VLLIDDDETWARTNARLLERQREAFSVVTATGLATAREAYEHHRPDCVVCDYQLDDGDGLELLAYVRETESDRPFVLVTGEGSEAVASDAIGRQVTDYVRKSTVADQSDLLARRIETAVRAYRTERALERERRSKDAVLDIVTASTSREGLTRAFCQHLVAERDYACAWIGTYAPGDGVVPTSVAGDSEYVDRVLRSGAAADAADEPALRAVASGEPCIVPEIGPDDRSDSAGNGVDADVPTETDETATETDESGATTGPAAWRRVASSCGFRAAAALPLGHGGTTAGVLAVYGDASTVVDAAERELLTDYAEAVGYALQTAEWKQSLLSAASVTADVTVADDAAPLVALCRALPAGTTVTARTALLRDEDRLLYVADVAGAPVEAVRDAAESVPAVVDVTAESTAERGSAESSSRDGANVARCRCELLVETPTPEHLLVARGSQFVETVVAGRSATVSVAAASHEGVAELRRALEAEYDGVSVVSIRSDPEVTGAAPLDALTDKQRQALRLAFYEGYFERPRRHNTTELAEKLGVSRATFTQHVRAAERKVFGDLVGPSD
jgi:predicted DNA binding protein/ActR/RegA family two-component response regulator